MDQFENMSFIKMEIWELQIGNFCGTVFITDDMALTKVISLSFNLPTNVTNVTPNISMMVLL